MIFCMEKGLLGSIKLPKKLSKKLNFKKLLTKRNLALVFLIAFAILFYIFILKDLPLPTKLASSSNPQSTLIYDRNGKLLYDIYDKKNQSFIPLSSIPKYMQEATIAIEDRSFYQHGAVDFRGIAREIGRAS